MTDKISTQTLKIAPADPRYQAILDRRFNKRFVGHPDYVRSAGSTDDVIAAVQDAVSEGRRLVVTSGGHCLEGFVSDPGVRVIIDLSPMKRIYFDAKMLAVAVDAGATVGETFQALHQNWGVVIPLGEYPAIGMGGHVVGGGFGFLCRRLGLAADYLYAVEVVTVDRSGRAQRVLATCEASDPNWELWWGHTGAGGGNLGVVTRYWFRAPTSSGKDPTSLLPRSPEAITGFTAQWSWNDLDRPRVLRLLENFGVWSERNSAPDSTATSLFALFEGHRRQFGKLLIRGVSVSGSTTDGEGERFLAAMSEGVGAPVALDQSRMSWLDFALDPFPDLFATPPGGVSVKVKDALLKRRLSGHQLDIVYDYLTRTDYDVMGGMLGLATLGGRVNAVAPDATAFAPRQTILDLACNTGWLDQADEPANLAWVRSFYRELFADTGGVPLPGEAYDGALINHPDTDLADPSLNASGVPWPTLYYQANYPRLQRIKAQWDPLNIFHHPLSIRSA
jgi:aclacinomycin oxidase